jgi:hypothetical protein
MSTVTVSPGPERHRWTSAEKARIVEESLAGDVSGAEVARRHDISMPTQSNDPRTTIPATSTNCRSILHRTLTAERDQDSKKEPP